MESTSDQYITNNTNNPATPTTINPTAPTTSEVTDEDIIVAYAKLSTIMNRPLSTAEIEYLKEHDPTAEHLEELCEGELQHQLQQQLHQLHQLQQQHIS